MGRVGCLRTNNQALGLFHSSTASINQATMAASFEQISRIIDDGDRLPPLMKLIHLIKLSAAV